MFCKKCGSQLPENSVFCTSCGAPCDTSASYTESNRYSGVDSVFNEGISTMNSSHNSGSFNSYSGSGTYNQGNVYGQSNGYNQGNTYSQTGAYNYTPKKNKMPVIIGIVAAVLCIAVITVMLYIVLGKSDREKRDEKIVERGYVSEKTDPEEAFLETVDVYIDAIYDNNYDVFKECMFPGDFYVDRESFSTYSDKEYMSYYAPIYHSYDNFDKWEFDITDMECVDDSEELKELNDRYDFSGDNTIEVYYEVYFDMTMTSDIRKVSFPCYAEFVKADGHWYLWYTYFDAYSYYTDTYEFTGQGIDYFARDYVPYEEEQEDDFE